LNVHTADGLHSRQRVAADVARYNAVEVDERLEAESVRTAVAKLRRLGLHHGRLVVEITVELRPDLVYVQFAETPLFVARLDIDAFGAELVGKVRVALLYRDHALVLFRKLGDFRNRERIREADLEKSCVGSSLARVLERYA